MAKWTGGAGNDLFNGAAEADLASGLAGNDTLIGAGGDDTLKGGTGNDSMVGGNGSDLFLVDSASDIVVETNATRNTGGIDRVNSTASHYTLATNVEVLALLSTGAASGKGNGGANTLIAGAGDNTLDGAGGVDTASWVSAGAGVSVSLAITGAQATGGSGSDVLLRIENLTGSGFADSLTGSAGANMLDGGAGDDTLGGGAGNDRYQVDSSLDLIVEAVGEGTDSVFSRASAFTLPDNVENLRISTGAAANGTGNALGNLITAGNGDNAMDGGGGVDTLSYASAAAAVSIDLSVAGAQATGGSGSDTVTGIENLTGSRFADRLGGDGGANLLNGGAGADTLSGGAGDDAYVVGSSTDVVVEADGGGDDAVFSTAAGYTLPAAVESLVISTTGTASGTGNALDNRLFAGRGNNVLDGGAGTDWVRYDDAVDSITIDLSLTTAQATGGSGTDTLLNIENIAGGVHEDSLAGTGGSNAIDGGAGVDTLSGGAGNDVYYVDDGADVVIEASADTGTGGVDRIVSTAAAYTLPDNVEELSLASAGATDGTGNALANLILPGAGDNVLDGGDGIDRVDYAGAGAAITATLGAGVATGASGTDTLLNIEQLAGSAFNDRLNGDAGDNTLDGGAGSDTLAGGGGNDTYVVGNSTDLVTETDSSAAGGVDLVLSNAAAFTLGANLEQLRIVAAGAANATGNGLANTLYAGSGNNVLNGSSGNDTASYAFAGTAVSVNLSLGSAQATGGSGSDTLTSIENLQGSEQSDTLTGSSGANLLAGLGGADTLSGGAGNDTLTGGAGLDTFRFDTKPSANKNVDLLADFGSGDDRIALENGVFTALTATGALAADQLVLGTRALDANDYLVYTVATGQLYYDADGSGRGGKVLIAVLGDTTHPATLAAGDFIVT